MTSRQPSNAGSTLNLHLHLHCVVIVVCMTTATTLPPHVLVIDDDAAMRDLIADFLGENDLRVTPVATGAEMQKVLHEHAVDVVVLDLSSGRSLAEADG